MRMPLPVRLAAVQASPVLLDRDRSVELACQYIAEAAAAGATLVVFPEAFLAGYPFWVWHVPAGETTTLRAVDVEQRRQHSVFHHGASLRTTLLES